jgi:hypothetical protein
VCRGSKCPFSGRKSPTFSGRMCPFCRIRIFKAKFFPEKALVHCMRKTKISARKGTLVVHCTRDFPPPPKKTPAFLELSKDVESYSHMPGKRISALEFSNFSGETPQTPTLEAFRAFGARYIARAAPPDRRVCPFSKVAPRSRNPGSAPAMLHNSSIQVLYSPSG